METVLLIVHLMIAIALVATVLLQRSEGGALGIGGGGGGGGLMSGRGAANVLTRTTGFLAAAFFASSIGLGLLAGMERGTSLLEQLPEEGISVPEAPAPEVPIPPVTLPDEPRIPYE